MLLATSNTFDSPSNFGNTAAFNIWVVTSIDSNNRYPLALNFKDDSGSIITDATFFRADGNRMLYFVHRIHCYIAYHFHLDIGARATPGDPQVVSLHLNYCGFA